MRILLSLVLPFSVFGACSVSVSTPAQNEVTAGYQYTLTSAHDDADCPARAYTVEYDMDGETAGVTFGAPYSLAWNPFNLGNGWHAATAVMRDVLNNVLATSATVNFKVENDLPQQTCPQCSDIAVSQTWVAGSTWTNGGVSGAIVALGFQGPSVPTIVNSAGGGGGGTSGTIYLPNVVDGATVLVMGGTSGQPFNITDNAVPPNLYTCESILNVLVDYGCFVLHAHNIPAGGTLVISLSMASGSYIYGTGIQLAGATAPHIQDTSTIGSGGNSVSTDPFVPGPPELVFVNTTNNNNQSLNPSAGWSCLGSCAGQIAYHAFTDLSQLGTLTYVVTANGPKANNSKMTYLYVDGQQVSVDAGPGGSGNTANPVVLTLDSTKFTNAAHQVVITSQSGNVSRGFQGTWGSMGQWEQVQTFSNPPKTPMELRASPGNEVFLLVSGSGTCAAGSSASCTLTGNIYNTDGTSSPATITSCTESSGGTVVSVGPNCTVTAASSGYTTVTMTALNGMNRNVGVWVLSTNVVPHFAVGGTFNMAYDPATSLYHKDIFASGIGGGDTAKYVAGGWNIAELDGTCVGTPNGANLSESAYYGTLANCVNNVKASVTGGIKGVHLLWDSYFRGTPELFSSQYGVCATFSVPCFQKAISLWKASGVVVGMSGVDEFTSSWGGSPLGGTDIGGYQIGSNGIGSITCGGGTCRFSSVNVSGNAFGAIALNGSRQFLIRGSTLASGLNWVPGSNGPLFMNSDASIMTGSTFQSSFTGTATDGFIEPYVAWAYDSSGNACPPGGGSGGPCSKYVQFDVFKKIRAQLEATPGYPSITWPPPTGATNFISQLSGKSSVGGAHFSDYWESYWSPGALNYLPTRMNIHDLEVGASEIAIFRGQLPNIQLNAPILLETSTLTADYAFTGDSLPVSVCGGDTITFAQPHNTATVIDGVTRLLVPNSSGGCNNVAPTTLSSAISSDGTSLTLASAAGYVAPQILYTDSEAIWCQTLSGNTYSNCIRGVAGSGLHGQNVSAHAAGAVVVPYLLEYVISAPSATMVRVYPYAPAPVTATSGTITFDDGAVYANGSGPNQWERIDVQNSNVCFNSPCLPQGRVNLGGSCPGVTFLNHRGHTFTITGQSATFYQSWQASDNCDTFPVDISVMENLASSGGGTAMIIRDNNFIQGRNWFPNGRLGPRYMAATHDVALTVGTAGTRSYSAGDNPQRFDRTGKTSCSSPPCSTTFPPNVAQFNGVFLNYALGGIEGGNQAGVNFGADYAYTFEALYAATTPNRMADYLLPFAMQSRLPSPDYGPNFITAARSGSAGNWLRVESLADGPLVLQPSVNLYDLGKPFYRVCHTAFGVGPVATFASGEVPGAYKYAAGEVCDFMLPINGLTGLRRPVMNVGGLNGASHAVVQYADSVLAFQSSVSQNSLFQSIDCTSGCIVPYARDLGPMYYRILATDASWKVTSIGDVQSQ